MIEPVPCRFMTAAAFVLEIRQHHRRALIEEEAHGGFADAAGASGDERDLTPEPLHPRGPGCSLLLLDVVAGEGRPHVAAREQHRRDDLDRRVAAEALASDGGPRRLATLAEQLDEQVRRAIDHPGLIAEAGR